ncbi:MAG: prepilin-type N-terminal cleavage/methylation domain-containing protein [Desulfobacterales bacterium]|nr:prepilin-type N-terminal cleavage/methylation domain-containing protein [Desulfobacterales bacterium]
MDMNQKGFTLIEILIAVLVAVVAIGAIQVVYSSSHQVFQNVKSISDNVETKTPSIELIARYFDRWGVGVMSQAEKPACTSCPTTRKVLTIVDGDPCDTVTFFGNIQGFGFVQSVAAGTANVTSCRLSTSTPAQNCYYLWTNNDVTNTIDAGNFVPLELNADLTPNNTDCLGVTSGAPTNATVNAVLTPKSGAVVVPAAVPGDMIQRGPQSIRLYCSNNSQDSNRRWLYADLDETSPLCGANDPLVPIAPVDRFEVLQTFPAGCVPANGNCDAVQIRVVFRSQTKNQSGQYDTYTVDRIFGR